MLYGRIVEVHYGDQIEEFVVTKISKHEICIVDKNTKEGKIFIFDGEKINLICNLNVSKLIFSLIQVILNEGIDLTERKIVVKKDFYEKSLKLNLRGANLLEFLRDKNNMTNCQLSEIIGKSIWSIRKILSGVNGITELNAGKFAKYFGLSMVDFVDSR